MGLSSSRWAWCSRRAEEASVAQHGDLGNCPRQERGGRSWQKVLLRAAGMGWSLAAEPRCLWGEPLDVQRVTFFGEGVASFSFLNIITPCLGSFPKYNLEKKWSWSGERGALWTSACCKRLPCGGRPAAPTAFPSFPQRLRGSPSTHATPAQPGGPVGTPAP